MYFWQTPIFSFPQKTDTASNILPAIFQKIIFPKIAHFFSFKIVTVSL